MRDGIIVNTFFEEGFPHSFTFFPPNTHVPPPRKRHIRFSLREERETGLQMGREAGVPSVGKLVYHGEGSRFTKGEGSWFTKWREDGLPRGREAG